ncbi:Acyl-CoA dehydrogenase [Hartmannibacter diazotrophicus]|uniref:3-methylmercaptopropionyl-CoA dehydrogenase n=1 Tax=Hartmannibacter diazotrophicus TaxID=1482074 RepID=A0A2C9DDY8_9HYPH|nr:acyl-CoA dehydrogenase C-terminal domain-containing protein [Hartmannibacter diazotrophicus]SON58328.1 Acyl-CoA dehydrogenase [Hartmannibacter diazotrophicus]
MPIYRAPVEDARFLLSDVFDIARYSNLAGFSDATPDTIDAVLDAAARLCEDVIQPLNRIGDVEGCTRNEDGSVTTPTGFPDAYRQLAEGGWVGLSADPEIGGTGLPFVFTCLMNEFLSSANVAFCLYPSLTQGAITALAIHGNEEQKALYLPKLVEGTWTGTMNLTEPQAGTDLGLLRAKAVANGDGSYAISGTKIFISAGEHDLTENIVHLVLARIEGAPAGTKGISMFVVPKFIPDANGKPGEKNAVSCGSLEEKMGIHGSPTCVLNFDGATGWLVGEPHSGLKAMFTMMNEARLGVGIQGLGLSEVAYQNAAAYARDRRQGRAMSGPSEPDKAADLLVVHPDIRRMLLTMRAFNEGGRALVAWTALQSDIAHRSEDEAAAKLADGWLGLATPIVKAFLTDKGFENTVLAQQVFGGHGYITEWGMEQFVRDARIAMIYEGANGIQALDLVGRKLGRDGGKPVMALFKEIGDFVAENAGNKDLEPYVLPLGQALKDLQSATMWFMTNAMKKPENAGAGSTDYLNLFALVLLAWMWARMARVAQEKLAANEGNPAFWNAKLITGRFFMEHMLPETGANLARITSGADTMMAMPAEAF